MRIRQSEVLSAIGLGLKTIKELLEAKRNGLFRCANNRNFNSCFARQISIKKKKNGCVEKEGLKYIFKI